MNFYQHFINKTGILSFSVCAFIVLSAGASSSSDPDDSVSSYSMMSSPALASGDWDIDGDGRADALTDGLLFLRYAFGLTGDYHKQVFIQITY